MATEPCQVPDCSWNWSQPGGEGAARRGRGSLMSLVSLVSLGSGARAGLAVPSLPDVPSVLPPTTAWDPQSKAWSCPGEGSDFSQDLSQTSEPKTLPGWHNNNTALNMPYSAWRFCLSLGLIEFPKFFPALADIQGCNHTLGHPWVHRQRTETVWSLPAINLRGIIALSHRNCLPQ